MSVSFTFPIWNELWDQKTQSWIVQDWCWKNSTFPVYSTTTYTGISSNLWHLCTFLHTISNGSRKETSYSWFFIKRVSVYSDKINGHFLWDVPKAHMCNPSRSLSPISQDLWEIGLTVFTPTDNYSLCNCQMSLVLLLSCMNNLLENHL